MEKSSRWSKVNFISSCMTILTVEQNIQTLLEPWLSSRALVAKLLESSCTPSFTAPIIISLVIFLKVVSGTMPDAHLEACFIWSYAIITTPFER